MGEGNRNQAIWRAVNPWRLMEALEPRRLLSANLSINVGGQNVQNVTIEPDDGKIVVLTDSIVERFNPNGTPTLPSASTFGINGAQTLPSGKKLFTAPPIILLLAQDLRDRLSLVSLSSWRRNATKLTGCAARSRCWKPRSRACSMNCTSAKFV